MPSTTTSAPRSTSCTSVARTRTSAASSSQSAATGTRAASGRSASAGRARLLGLAGRRAGFRHDTAAGLEYAREFAAIAERLDDALAMASATFDLARAHEVGGDLESASAEYARSAELFHGRNDPSEAAALDNLVGIELVRGNYATARERARDALQLATKAGYPDAIIGSTTHIGSSYLREGRTDEAKPWVRRALEEDACARSRRLRAGGAGNDG